VPNFEFASLAILELLAFNAQKIKGHVTLGHVGNLVPDVCAKFHQNRSKIATLRGHERTHKCVGHRTSDTANDFIFCPLSNAAMHSIGQTIIYGNMLNATRENCGRKGLGRFFREILSHPVHSST